MPGRERRDNKDAAAHEIDGSAHRATVPVWLDSFIGREAELEQASRLLRTTRLLTLTGAGGSGKTRLAAELVRSRVGEFAQGARWVDLAATTGLAQVVEQLAMSAGIASWPSGGAFRLLAAHFEGASMLVCLDNCEQVLDALAEVAAELLTLCPTVSVLATSREPLRVAGETVWTVPTMAADDAVALFLERGRQVCPGFGDDPADVASVATVCARLDGLPLALELAAAWLRALTARQIEAELDDRFALLVRGPRGVVARHETLLASMAWSYDMLERSDQLVFRRLAVFSGGFTIDAARAVCSPGARTDDNVLVAIGRLVDKSLLVAEHAEGAARYHQLETVRAYGRDRLTEAGETAAARDRHLGYFLGLVESISPVLDADADRWRLQLAPELDNLRDALDWGLAAEDPERGRRLAAGLSWLWHLRGDSREGFAYLQRAIERDPGGRSLLQALLLAGVAIIADTADPERELGAAQLALEIAAEHDDSQLKGLCLQLSAIGHLYTDFDAAWRLNLEAEEVAQKAGGSVVYYGARTLRGVILHLRDDHAESAPLLRDAAEGLMAHGNRHIAATALAFRAEGEAVTGNLQDALLTAQRAVELAQPLGDYHRVGTTRSMLALVQGLAGHLDAALATISPVRRLIEGSADEIFVPWFALVIGRLCLWRGDPEQALPWLRREAASTVQGQETYLSALALPVLGATLRHLSRDDEAATVLGHAEEVARRLGMPRALADALEQRAFLISRDDPEAALELHHGALAARAEHGLRTFYPDSLDALAELAVITNRADRAARLLSASEQERRTTGHPRPPVDQAAHEQLLATIRDVLGEGLFAEQWTAGGQLTIEAAVALATRSRGTRERPSTGWGSLTPTEREVAELAAAGHANPDIAGRLFMSRGTVKTHLSHIYTKLGVANRTELSARTPSKGRSQRA